MHECMHCLHCIHHICVMHLMRTQVGTTSIDGYRMSATLLVSGFDAPSKARLIATSILDKVRVRVCIGGAVRMCVRVNLFVSGWVSIRVCGCCCVFGYTWVCVRCNSYQVCTVERSYIHTCLHTHVPAYAHYYIHAYTHTRTHTGE